MCSTNPPTIWISKPRGAGQALNAFDGTLLMVAHDRYLLSEVADEAWSMDGDGITVYKEGFAVRRCAARGWWRQGREGKEKDAGRKAGAPSRKALDREELKRLKRQASSNALYKKMRPKQEAYAKLETQRGVADGAVGRRGRAGRPRGVRRRAKRRNC
ncbi:MAG: hypothetical protein ACLSAH_18750 [Bilophila wadsworthia]